MSMPGPRWRHGQRWLVTGVLVALLCLLMVNVVALTRHAHDSPRSSDGLRRTLVEVSGSRCGAGWDEPSPGLQVFALHNTSAASAEVFLQDPRSHVVYGEVEDIGPGTTRELTVRLGRGTYAFKCLPEDAD
ncbi:EfeM/EfeO family lipoprotein, partial [Streptomyces sp. 900105245]